MSEEQQKENFENALKELEKVVGKLEAGNLPLEESIKLYEKGVQLNRVCEERLKKAESKIEQLKKSLQDDSA